MKKIGEKEQEHILSAVVRILSENIFYKTRLTRDEDSGVLYAEMQYILNNQPAIIHMQFIETENDISTCLIAAPKIIALPPKFDIRIFMNMNQLNSMPRYGRYLLNTFDEDSYYIDLVNFVPVHDEKCAQTIASCALDMVEAVMADLGRFMLFAM